MDTSERRRPARSSPRRRATHRWWRSRARALWRQWRRAGRNVWTWFSPKRVDVLQSIGRAHGLPIGPAGVPCRRHNELRGVAAEVSVRGRRHGDVMMAGSVVAGRMRARHTALYGPRFAVQSSDEFARAIGYPRAPVDDLLVFHVVFGKTVPDVSLNAVANLGYAECRFLKPVYPGDTLSASSEVIGLKENSNRKTGIVYVRSRGRNQNRQDVLEYVRWVMVRKR